MVLASLAAGASAAAAAGEPTSSETATRASRGRPRGISCIVRTSGCVPVHYSMQRHGALVERGAKPSRQFRRFAIGPEWQEEEPRLLVQHVAMDGRHIDPVGSQGLDDGIDLITGENEVAGDGSLAAAGRLKIYGSRA